MTSENLIATLASELRQAEADRRPIPSIRGRMPDDDGETAYAVQKVNVEYWQGQGRRVVGRKIGLTSRAVQTQLGVNQPDFGTIFADTIYGDDEPISFERLMQPKAEAEVALVLKRDC